MTNSEEGQTRPPELNITPEENAELEAAFKAKSEETGFKTYYPTFIPENLTLNKGSLTVSNIGQTGKLITYNLSSNDATAAPLVYIQEQTEGMALDSNIPAQQEAAYLKGYIKTIQTDAGSFYVLVFLKDQ